MVDDELDPSHQTKIPICIDFFYMLRFCARRLLNGHFSFPLLLFELFTVKVLLPRPQFCNRPVLACVHLVEWDAQLLQELLGIFGDLGHSGDQVAAIVLGICFFICFVGVVEVHEMVNEDHTVAEVDLVLVTFDHFWLP